MERIHILSILFSSISTSKIYNLRLLSFFLFNFSFSHSDFHICFSKTLHRRCCSSWTWIIKILWIIFCLRLSTSTEIRLESTFKFLHKLSITFNMCNKIQFHNWIGWDIWCFIFKSSMHIYCLIICSPYCVSKSLNWVEFFPFRIFSFIHFHENILSNSICSSSKYNHQSTNENSWMLISC